MQIKKKGIFLSFEGPEASGKSTQIHLLKNYLQKNKIPFITTREPGGTIVAEKLRKIILGRQQNISTIEVEGVLYQHPAVAEAAVVAKPDEKWGETPCAFVALKDEVKCSEEELIQFCRDNLAHFKCPKKVVFTELPKTSTGKIQKFVLRDLVKAL